MIRVTIKNRSAVAVPLSPVTSGAVGIPVQFSFSDDWAELQKIAVFRNGKTSVDVALAEDSCAAPPETLITGDLLWIGVYGSNTEGNIIIPTVWANAGMVKEGTMPSGVDPSEPTPSWVAQVQEAAETALATATAVQEAAEAGEFDGEDGVSPAVTIKEITGGHTVTITDRDHPSGQSFDVMDGSGGGALPEGGLVGDILTRTGASSADWVTPASSAQQDNTRPITAAAVYTEIGNINALLATI